MDLLLQNNSLKYKVTHYFYCMKVYIVGQTIIAWKCKSHYKCAHNNYHKQCNYKVSPI